MAKIEIYNSSEKDAEAMELIKNKCLDYGGKDPIELAVDIMNNDLIRMHGPEHHFIVPAVLITALHNYQSQSGSLAKKLDIAEKRAKTETPQTCTFKHGTCGAAQGTGVFMSMHLDREISDEDAWSPTNLIVAESLKRVAESHGPRCCKRDTYMAIETSIKFLKDKFAVELPFSDAKCTFSLRNESCGHEDCEYYNLSNSLV